MIDTEKRVCAHQCIWQCVEPAQHSMDMTLPHERPTVFFNEASSSVKIVGSQSMLYGFGDESVLFVPYAGATMQCGDERGFCLLQVAREHLGKQVVVAVPVPLVIERSHKQVRAFERFEHRLAPLLFRHGLAE